MARDPSIRYMYIIIIRIAVKPQDSLIGKYVHNTWKSAWEVFRSDRERVEIKWRNQMRGGGERMACSWKYTYWHCPCLWGDPDTLWRIIWSFNVGYLWKLIQEIMKTLLPQSETLKTLSEHDIILDWTKIFSEPTEPTALHYFFQLGWHILIPSRSLILLKGFSPWSYLFPCNILAYSNE